MGNIFSIFKKPSDTKTILGNIQSEIESIEEYKWTISKRQKNYIGLLMLVSILMYIICALLYYFIYLPKSGHWKEIILYSLPFIVFPLLVWFLKRLLQFYYRWVLDSKDDKLRKLKKQKQKILEKVQETETFKDAKEILEKYDPKALQDISRRNSTESTTTMTPQLTDSQLRYRRTPITSLSTLSTPINRTPMAPGFSGLRIGINQNISARPSLPMPFPRLPMMPPQTPKPILPQNRGVVEKLVDYVVGDGPSNRYALICAKCHGHNGMALKEEFEFITFKCCYCFYINPARKARPFAPRLPSQPLVRTSMAPVIDELENQRDTTNQGTIQENSDQQLNTNTDQDNNQEDNQNKTIDESISITETSESIDSQLISENAEGINNEENKSDKVTESELAVSKDDSEEIEFIDHNECKDVQEKSCSH